MSRTYKRDPLGRFAGAGTKVTSATKRAYVSGSFTKNLAVGKGGAYKGVKVGAEFRTPKGRGAVAKGIVGYRGKPNRKLDITPSLVKSQKKLTVTARPASVDARSTPPGTSTASLIR
ncbi:hypothetical protein HH308_15040 [Gordonia sp. TBRC 11910]|uniref:Uncharacterized protein n=1 Tax=Gordonia asplenii TaxID=2725283 RepID=A0A848KVG3_9ACTN|nr:hypothetical protein [Gordonia asplenii]NMO02530.1 hypothetical protein [Gordonia asplenii]